MCKIKVDLLDNGTFGGCPAELCQIDSYASGTLLFTVAHFTTFQGAEGAAPPPVPEFSTIALFALLGLVLCGFVVMRKRT